MSEPASYRRGCERLFKRAETAANVGREIGLQYVQVHVRYAATMGNVGNADELWWAWQVGNAGVSCTPARWPCEAAGASPYRPRAWRVPAAHLRPRLGRARNLIDVVL